MEDEKDRETTAATARAEALFAGGYLCSQAVLMALAPRLGIDQATAAGVVSGFGAGMARHGWTCGALAGAFMAIGLHGGHRTAEDETSKEETFARVQALVARFREAHGSTACRELAGCDMLDAAARQAASDAGVFRTTCPPFVRTATAWVEELLGASASSRA